MEVVLAVAEPVALAVRPAGVTSSGVGPAGMSRGPVSEKESKREDEASHDRRSIPRWTCGVPLPIAPSWCGRTAEPLSRGIWAVDAFSHPLSLPIDYQDQRDLAR